MKGRIATTLKEGLVVDMRSLPGNLHDGHTLAETLEQVSILAECKPTTAIVDKGYKGAQIEGAHVLRSGQKRGITRTLRATIHRRSAIEPAIEHMKMDGRLGCNPLKGALDDALHAVMCGAGHNLRVILAKLRLLYASLAYLLGDIVSAALMPSTTTGHLASGETRLFGTDSLPTAFGRPLFIAIPPVPRYRKGAHRKSFAINLIVTCANWVRRNSIFHEVRMAPQAPHFPPVQQPTCAAPFLRSLFQ
ncbi:hypothetical protein ABIC46_001436 [Variovorax paradoxus]